jgi:hypothetical protein
VIATDIIALNTKGFTDVIDITGRVTKIVGQSGVQNGLVTVFCSGSHGKEWHWKKWCHWEKWCQVLTLDTRL